MSKLGCDPFDAAIAALVDHDEDGAIVLFRRALAGRPRVRPLAWVTLGALLRTRGELGEAIECFVRATELLPLRDRSAAVLCETLRDAGRRDEARLEAERFMGLVRAGHATCSPYNERIFEACAR